MHNAEKQNSQAGTQGGNARILDAAAVAQDSVADEPTTVSVVPGEKEGSQIQRNTGTMEMNVTVDGEHGNTTERTNDTTGDADNEHGMVLDAATDSSSAIALAVTKQSTDGGSSRHEQRNR